MCVPYLRMYRYPCFLVKLRETGEWAGSGSHGAYSGSHDLSICWMVCCICPTSSSISRRTLRTQTDTNLSNFTSQLMWNFKGLKVEKEWTFEWWGSSSYFWTLVPIVPRKSSHCCVRFSEPSLKKLIWTQQTQVKKLQQVWKRLWTNCQDQRRHRITDTWWEYDVRK